MDINMTFLSAETLSIVQTAKLPDDYQMTLNAVGDEILWSVNINGQDFQVYKYPLILRQPH
jgi:hypothetical protein